jgi:tetratricopeptide (TPR) repeat protein
MQKRIHSQKDLKAAFRESALAKGLALSHSGRYAEAVAFFDTVQDFAALDAESKSAVKTSYCTHGKNSQHAGNFGEALRCFSRARETYPDDILILERTKLLASYRRYKTWENIAEFRKCFGFGFTSGGYDKYKYPFLEIAKEKGILEESQLASPSKLIDSLHTVGTYRIQAQGRHLLSYKIREYKGKHPFSSANPALALPFAWLLADFIKSMTELLRFVDVIVPSPSNPENYVARGFIPSLRIGQALSKCLAIPYRELFSVAPMPSRFRDMAYSEAKNLIRYAQKRYDKIVCGNGVLLVDDVITTGRTLTLLADLLESAGARVVYGVALAKTGVS